MKKVLIAVDETESAKSVLYTFYNLVQQPEEVILLNVQRLEGQSLMIDMLGDSEMSTLRESLQGTDHKEHLDVKSEKILDFYRKEMAGGGFNLKTVVRDGKPAEEILKLADEEKVDLIILGYKKRKGYGHFITGSVLKDIEKGAEVPVLTARRPAVCEEPYTWRDAYYAMSFFSAIVVLLFLVGKVLQKSGAILP